MAMITFSPTTIIKSADMNSNFSGLADGTLIADGAIMPNHIGRMKYAKIERVTVTTGITNAYAQPTISTVVADPESWYNASSIRPTEAGLYMIIAKATDNGSSDTEMTFMKITKNGTMIGREYQWGGASSEVDTASFTHLEVLAANDDITIEIKNDDNASQVEQIELTVVKLSS